MPSTYPSSVPSTSCCAPRSSTATTVACHIPPQLRFTRGVLDLRSVVMVTLACFTFPRCSSLLPKQPRFASLRCEAPNSRVIPAPLRFPSACGLAAAVTASRLRPFGAFSSQQSGDVCVLTLRRFADSLLSKQPRACASDSRSSTAVVTFAFSHFV